MPNRCFPPLVLGVFLAALACGGPTTPPAEHFFTDAKQNLASMDYEGALKNLERLMKSAEGQPLGKQGEVLRTALLVSLAEATMKMGQAYDTGARQPEARAQQSQFVKMKSDYYGIARTRLMNSMEAVMAQRGKLADPLPLNISFPDFTGTDPVVVSRVEKGMWAADNDRYRAELEVVRNALARTLARLAGAGDDVHKGRTTFEKGGVQIDPRVYLLELSTMFYKLSDLFDRKALDDPRYRRISLEVVRDNADILLKMLEAKPDPDLEKRAKKLKADCEAALKKMPA
jgi:hypothetical protein